MIFSFDNNFIEKGFMQFREAILSDISKMHNIRIAVKENILPDPGLITKKDYEEFMTKRGRGWVCETDDRIVGFAIADLADNNVWALFIQPGYEGNGIAKRLHEIMIDWYFNQTNETIWLGTAAGTRAEKFYRKAGWNETGVQPNGEIRFEMTYDCWIKIKKLQKTNDKIEL